MEALAEFIENDEMSDEFFRHALVKGAQAYCVDKVLCAVGSVGCDDWWATHGVRDAVVALHIQCSLSRCHVQFLSVIYVPVIMQRQSLEM